MITPLATATFPTTQLPTASPIVIKGVSTTNSHRVSLFKTTSCPRIRGASFGFPVVAEGRAFLVHASSLTNLQELLEDPDDGSNSEDENEEVEENDLDFLSDWEAERGVVMIPNRIAELSASNYEEDLVNEVEQLLEPEEIAILQQNETPNMEKSKWSPLHTVSLAGQIPFMDWLLENGLDIDLVDKDGLTALHKAIIGKKEAVISHLLRKGASIHARDLDGATPLHYAVQVGAMQTVKLMFKYKVDVNIANNDGWTPLHVAMQIRNRDITKILLVDGADKTRRNEDGKTPLDLSLCYGKLLKLVPATRYM